MSSFAAPMPRLARQSSIATSMGTEETKEEKLLRFLQYECTYRHCAHPGFTWGDIITKDYAHFVDLMSHHVPAASKTFDVLKEKLAAADVHKAEFAMRVHIAESSDEVLERYLKMGCSHNGRMKGKTWGHILKTDYEYFVWAVGNTMGRDTRSFKVFFECLRPVEASVVQNTPKGQVKVRRDRRPNKQG